MNTTKNKKREDLNVTFTPSNGHKLSKEDIDLMEEHTKLHHSRRSPERIIKNQMLSVLYHLEEYLYSFK